MNKNLAWLIVICSVIVLGGIFYVCLSYVMVPAISLDVSASAGHLTTRPSAVAKAHASTVPATTATGPNLVTVSELEPVSPVSTSGVNGTDVRRKFRVARSL